MNAQYNASSRPARSVIAMLACVATVTVLGSIGGLAEYYGNQSQLASAKPVAVAQR
jgi:phage shock protein PspC (stress-responsive transcriptional regulator)